VRAKAKGPQKRGPNDSRSLDRLDITVDVDNQHPAADDGCGLIRAGAG
jgi:hypothetical protein